MPEGPDFSIMDVGETIAGAIDFGNWLGSGVSIASIASVIVANYWPNRLGDPPYVTLVGSPQIGSVSVADGGSGVANGAVLQQWRGAAEGAARIIATVLTSDGQTLSQWAHQPVAVPR